MYKFSLFLEDGFILDLEFSDFKKVVSHDYLKVEQEALVLKTVLQFCVKNKLTLKHLEDLLACVRWKLVLKEEVNELIKEFNSLPRSAIETAHWQASSLDGLVQKREWPQLLVLIEQPPYATGRGEMPIRSEIGACTVQAYDKKHNSWIQLTEVPETEMNWNMYKRKNKMTRRGRYSSQCCHNKVIVTLPKFSDEDENDGGNDPFDVEVQQSVYDVWSGEWSSESTVAVKEKVLLNDENENDLLKDNNENDLSKDNKKGKLALMEPHSLVSDNLSLFMIFSTICENPEGVSQPKNIILNKCELITLDGHLHQKWNNYVIDCKENVLNKFPKLAVTGKQLSQEIHILDLFPKTGIKGNVSLHTFNTETNEWKIGKLFSKAKAGVDGGSFIGFMDSIYVVGGMRMDSQEATGRVVKYLSTGGNPTNLQCMMKARIGPGLAEHDGWLFAAGGYAKARNGSKKWSRDVEPTVEYYVPTTGTWHIMNSQPKIKYGRIALGVVDKPIRLIQSLSM